MGSATHLWEIWLVALITVGIYSSLYSDNKVYRIILNTMIGLSVGYSFIIAWKLTIGPKWWDPAWGAFQPRPSHWFVDFFTYIFHNPGAIFLWLLLGLMGSLWYFQLSRKYMWLSRIIIGIMVGVGAGYTFKGAFLLNAPQITDSFRPFLATKPNALWSSGAPTGLAGADFGQSLFNIIFVATIACVMIYFFFSFSHERRGIGSMAKTGRWMLMIAFGAFFGNTVMTRMAVFLERLQDLIKNWAPKPVAVPLSLDRTIPSITCALIAIALIILGVLLIGIKKPKKRAPGSEVEDEPVGVPVGGEA